MTDNRLHAGISMHKIAVGSGFAGLVFTLGTVFIFGFGVPFVGFAFLAAIPFGLLLAAILRRVHRKPRPIISIRP